MTKHANHMCENVKQHSSCLKSQQIILDGNGGECGLHT